MPQLRSPVFPGSFDPPHLGHLDIAERALAVFGSLTIAVGANSAKSPVFTCEERVQLLREALGEREGLRIESFEGLLVEYCRSNGHDVVVRGVRGGRDLDYEMPMAVANRTLYPDLDTVFFVTASEHAFHSSTIIKELLAAGGDTSSFLPEAVLRAASDKFPALR
ncbi:MAG: pantetheine-phosphate adenylyltransferase [Planctomycetota bacterium]|nr:MAG: pantetheine-phosphate adenylyltransferase [Planctomycetota bacterium]